MNAVIKTCLSLLTVCVIVFASTTVSYAEQDITEETTESTTVPLLPPEEEKTEPSVTPEIPEDSDDDDVVGIIYLCSRWSSVTTTGHIWVYIENTSDLPITVGLLDVMPGEGVSLATFGFTRSDGFGIYYNMETYRNDKYCDESCISVNDTLTRKELEKITDKLLYSNYWDPFFNCVFFACSIWNTAGDTFIIPFFYPTVTRLQISIAGSKETCLMKYQPPENSYKQRGIGSNSYLENVSQKSLDAK